mmetsp:Transcript_5068/g.3718  ORF Transcript_5068/g.3718 Transcript_5068/m.3718 type:complete len:149 (+) Transcript_5068:588-1034(+)
MSKNRRKLIDPVGSTRLSLSKLKQMLRIIANSVRVMKVRKLMKAKWLRVPTQLFTHGQWWSKRSTHWLQMLQCRDRLVRITMQSGHNRTGSKFYNNVKKLMLWGFLRYPGSLNAEMVKKKTESAMKAVSAANHQTELKNGKTKSTSRK